jgi:hypothetical protein
MVIIFTFIKGFASKMIEDFFFLGLLTKKKHVFHEKNSQPGGTTQDNKTSKDRNDWGLV